MLRSRAPSLDERLRIASALYHCVRRCWLSTNPACLEYDSSQKAATDAYRRVNGLGTLAWKVMNEYRYTVIVEGLLCWQVSFMNDVKFELHVYHDLKVAQVHRWQRLACVGIEKKEEGPQKNFDQLLLEWLRQSVPQEK